MNMYKGLFKTETYNAQKPTINMVDWVEPTLYNNGTSTVLLNGMKILPGDSFILGPSGVEVSGFVNLVFPETGKHDIKVNYTILKKICQ